MAATARKATRRPDLVPKEQKTSIDGGRQQTCFSPKDMWTPIAAGGIGKRGKTLNPGRELETVRARPLEVIMLRED